MIEAMRWYGLDVCNYQWRFIGMSKKPMGEKVQVILSCATRCQQRLCPQPHTHALHVRSISCKFCPRA